MGKPDIFDEIKDVAEHNHAQISEIRARLDELQAKQERPHTGRTGSTSYADAVMSKLGDPDIRASLEKHSSVRFEVPSILFQKTLTSGGLPYEVTQPLPAGRYQYRLRGELAVSKTSAGSVIALRETYTNNAAPQVAQGDAKATSNFALTPVTLPISTIAHFCKVSKQAMDDLEGLGQYINASLVWGLEAAIEDQLLNGTGADGQMPGIYAGASNATTNLSGITRIDSVAYVADELSTAGFFPTHLIVSPTDWMKTTIQKNNQADYLLGRIESPDPVPTLWGLRVIVSPKMASNKAMIADFGKVVLRSRQMATVQASEHDSDNFERNLLTVRAEERLTVVSAAPASALKFSLPA